MAIAPRLLVGAVAAWAALRLAGPALLNAQLRLLTGWAPAYDGSIAPLRHKPGAWAPLECGPEGWEHLSELPAQGLQVLRAVDRPACDDGSDAVRVSVSVDGMGVRGGGKPPEIELPCADEGADVGEWLLAPLRRLVARERPLLHRRLLGEGLLAESALEELGARSGIDRWAYFTPFGSPLAPHPRELLRAWRECGVLFAIEGGQFVWPGVRVGHRRQLQSSAFGQINLTTLSLCPLLFTIQPLLTQQECAAIIAEAEPELEDSLYTGRDGLVSGSARTSQQTALPNGGSALVHGIEQRAHSLIRVPHSHGETLQVLRYGKGQQYKKHHDYFDPSSYKSQPEMLKLIEHGARNRFATLLWYIQAPAGGGETHFPRAGGLPPNQAVGDCTSDGGVKVAPVSGSATLFYSLRPDGAVDPWSMHAGCPPTSGKKWAVNKWIWNRPL